MSNPSIQSIEAINQAVDLYFQALHECDLAKFDRVFHPCCSLFDSTAGVFTAMPIAEYRQIIAQRRSPKSAGQARADQLISVDLLSLDAAVVKVQLRIHDNVFVDHLSLARIDGQFMIVAKVWHEVV